MQGCIKTATQSRCTMQRHKWLSLQDVATLMADEAVTHRPQTTTIAMDAKPTKHTQTLALRKARVIVRGEGWYSNPSGSRPNFSVNRSSPLTREARTWCGARDYCPFAMVVGMKRLVGVKQSLRLDGRKV